MILYLLIARINFNSRGSQVEACEIAPCNSEAVQKD